MSSSATEAQHGTAQHSTAQRSAAQRSTGWHSTEQHSTARHGTARHGTARHGTARHSTARHRRGWYGTAQHSTAQHTTVLHSRTGHSTACKPAYRTLLSSVTRHYSPHAQTPHIMFLLTCIQVGGAGTSTLTPCALLALGVLLICSLVHKYLAPKKNLVRLGEPPFPAVTWKHSGGSRLASAFT